MEVGRACSQVCSQKAATRIDLHKGVKRFVPVGQATPASPQKQDGRLIGIVGRHRTRHFDEFDEFDELIGKEVTGVEKSAAAAPALCRRARRPQWPLSQRPLADYASTFRTGERSRQRCICKAPLRDDAGMSQYFYVASANSGGDVTLRCVHLLLDVSDSSNLQQDIDITSKFSVDTVMTSKLPQPRTRVWGPPRIDNWTIADEFCKVETTLRIYTRSEVAFNDEARAHFAPPLGA
ncbi:hypothetical protein EVAR_60060_1 [Eumeta japonica]|uniref:Uncharacterized protein n=1 Tax=Eumeta variegata TaxID=151549 RepID=A0A4C1ZJW1_EUMVA|nr:hypothetical protein EVAR_60060_1 [Eumeta japonica]